MLAKTDKHENKYLQRALLKDEFVVYLLCRCEHQDLLKYEDIFLRSIPPIFIYNLSKNHTQINNINLSRFWQKIKKGNKNECWEWLGKPNSHGYGMYHQDKKSYQAHRVMMYILGCNPNNHIVRHICNNPICCNPNHLELGSQKDNMHDMANEYYASKPYQIKINKIKKLYNQGMNSVDISKTIGGSSSSIRRILKRHGIFKVQTRSEIRNTIHTNRLNKLLQKYGNYIQQEYENGYSIRKLSRKYSITTTMVNRILKNKNIQTRTRTQAIIMCNKSRTKKTITNKDI